MLLHIVRNLISCDLKIPSNLCFGWIDFLCSNSCASVSLKYILCPAAYCGEKIYNLWKLWRPKKSTDASLILQSILLDSLCLLNRLMNSVNSSFEWDQMKNISSMKLDISSGLHLALRNIISSKLAMNVLAKLGAYFCPWQCQKFWRNHWLSNIKSMMTSSNGNIFRVTGHLCGEFTGLRWIPRTKASGA